MTLAEVSSQYSTTVACSSSGNNSANNCLAIIKYGDVAKMQLNSSSNLFAGITPKATVSKDSDVGNGGDITLGAQGLTSSGALKSIFDVTGVYPGSIGISASLPAVGRISAGTATATVQVNKATLKAELSVDNGSNFGIYMDDIYATGEDYCSFYNRFVGNAASPGNYKLSLKHKRCSSFDLPVQNLIACVVFVAYPEVTTINQNGIPYGTAPIPLAYVTNRIPGNSTSMMNNFSYVRNVMNDSIGQLSEFPTSDSFAISLFFNTFRGYEGVAGGLHGQGAYSCAVDSPIYSGVGVTPYYFRSGNMIDKFKDLFEGRNQNRVVVSGTGVDQHYTTRFMSIQAPASATVSVYVLPEQPYLGATLGDYFDLSGTSRSMAYGTDFFGGSYLGEDFFPVGQARTFRKIASISVLGTTINNL